MDAVQPAAAQHDKDGCGVRRLVGSIRCRMNHWGWAGTCSARLLEILVCILTQSCRWTLTSHELFPVVCCSATNAQQQLIRQSTRRAVAHRVTGHFTAGLWQCDAGRPSCMSARQTSVCLERCGVSAPGNVTTWRRRCTTFTGRESRNESRFGWRFWRTAVSMDLHHSTLLATFTGWQRSSLVDGALRGDCGLIVPATARSTIGDRAFSVAAARAWNSLPLSVTSSASLPVFRNDLKTVLFTRSFPS